jgi:hypothetical protein
MYEVIRIPTEIKKYQDIFEKIIQDGKKLYKNKTVTFNPGKEKRDVYWSSSYWSTSKMFIKDKKELRYKNWFGITDKEPDKRLELVVEINFSLCRGNTSGKLIKDDGKIFVVHTGLIGQDKKDSIDNFWKQYKGKKFKNEKLALIGELPPDKEDLKDLSKEKIKEFQGQLINFIKEVQRIKTINIPNNGKPVLETSYLIDLSSIAQECEKLVIKKINKIQPIFNEEDTQELWIQIRDPIDSEEKFFMFKTNLCILVKEDTRDKNPNFKPGKRNGPFFNDRFPENARKIKSFKEDVGNIRNYKSHQKNDENRSKYIKVCKKYIDIEREPVTIQEFQKFQIEILNGFKASLEELLGILQETIKNNPSSP